MKFIKKDIPKEISKNIFLLNKKEGETPLLCLEFFRLKNKIDKKIKMTYAGRLDPMASGLLLVLSDAEVKNKERYLSLDKEYEFGVLFGFRTDTYDILGKVTSNYELKITNYELEKDIKRELKNFKGIFMQKYPAYSSKTVKGKTLFSYARAKQEVEIPEREVNVKSLKFIKIRKINNKKLLENIERRVRNVKGDFRQKEILRIWKKELKKDNNFYIVNFKIKCSSGTYVRAIANSLGEKVGTGGLAFSIKRTRVGKYMI